MAVRERGKKGEFINADRPFPLCSLSKCSSRHRAPRHPSRISFVSVAGEHRLLSSSYLPQQVHGGVGGAPGADVAGERERRRRAGEDALRVEVADVDLDGGVVLGGDELVGPRAGVEREWFGGVVREGMTVMMVSRERGGEKAAAEVRQTKKRASAFAF